MWGYFAGLSWRSLRRTPALTALMVLTIALGIGASMTSFAVFRAASGDPIPWKSHQLFVPLIDLWGPEHHDDDKEPPDALSYTDATALMRAHAAKHQSALYPVGFSLIPADASRSPFTVQGHAVYSEFFPMVDVGFRYGGSWGETGDEQHLAQVVISSALNEKLFGGENSVGREIDLDGTRFRIVGVLEAWNPQPLFYDIANGNHFGSTDDLFVPFNWAIDHRMQTRGNNNCATDSDPGWDGYLRSSCVWISMLVELPAVADAEAYRRFLDGYHSEQQAAGRFDWAPNNRLHNLPEWLAHEHVVPDESRVSMLIAFGFLIVCLFNVIGLLLAKFMRRAPEIGVRRALGASRGRIVQQFVIESGVIGLVGGLLGLGFTALGLAGVGLIFDPDIADLARLDSELVLATVLLAVIATVLAGLFPTLRAAQVRPAWQLKAN
ncbi:MAG: ABC transporter permease [Gammaproteobacteria bacterium]|nr:ABC transporter permease [Gammaproteobacteria bacterium]